MSTQPLIDALDTLCATWVDAARELSEDLNEARVPHETRLKLGYRREQLLRCVEKLQKVADEHRSDAEQLVWLLDWVQQGENFVDYLGHGQRLDDKRDVYIVHLAEGESLVGGRGYGETLGRAIADARTKVIRSAVLFANAETPDA